MIDIKLDPTFFTALATLITAVTGLVLAFRAATTPVVDHNPSIAPTQAGPSRIT